MYVRIWSEFRRLDGKFNRRFLQGLVADSMNSSKTAFLTAVQRYALFLPKEEISSMQAKVCASHMITVPSSKSGSKFDEA